MFCLETFTPFFFFPPRYFCTKSTTKQPLLLSVSVWPAELAACSVSPYRAKNSAASYWAKSITLNAGKREGKEIHRQKLPATFRPQWAHKSGWSVCFVGFSFFFFLPAFHKPVNNKKKPTRSGIWRMTSKWLIQHQRCWKHDDIFPAQSLLSRDIWNELCPAEKGDELFFFRTLTRKFIRTWRSPAQKSSVLAVNLVAEMKSPPSRE